MNRSLALHLFEGSSLTEEEQKTLNYVVCSGAYGSLENGVNYQIQKKGRFGFFLSRLTIHHDDMVFQYPILKKAPFLYPFVVVWRIIYRFFTNHKKFMYEFKAALGIAKEKKH